MNDKLKACTNLFIHWDAGYWYAFYVFLLIQGSFIVASSQVYITESLESREIILWLVPICAFFFSILWLFVMNNKRTYTRGAEIVIEREIPEIWETARIKQKQFLGRIDSALIVQTGMPILFASGWLILLLLLLTIK